MQKNLYILKLYTKLSLPKKMLTAQHLRRKFEGVGWWWWGLFVSHTPHHHPTPDTQTQMSQYHRHNLNVRGGVVVGGSIEIGKKIYRFKTEG